MNTNGIGLGLVISENIVSQFDGIIDFDSIPDEGSTFTFTFKLTDDASIDQNVVEEVSKSYLLNNNELYFEWEPNFSQNELLESNIEYVFKVNKLSQSEDFQIKC